MAKIVELEKQLMQRNKELDVIRVRATRQLWLGVVMDLLRVLRWEVMTLVTGHGLLLAPSF